MKLDKLKMIFEEDKPGLGCGKVDVTVLQDDSSFFPDRTIVVRMIRNGFYVTCTHREGALTYEEAVMMRSEMNQRLNEVISKKYL